MTQHDLVATDEPLAFGGTLLRRPGRVGDIDEGGWPRPPAPQHSPPAPDIAPPAVEALDALVISDLHLGSENCQAKDLVELLERILAGTLPTSRLIINGDVFDSIDFRRLKKSHWKVLSQIRHLSDKIEVVWIAGNHDGPAEIISHLLGVAVCEEFIFTSGGRKVLCIHGHAFDDFIEDHPVLTWLADCVYWALQKIDRTHYVARLAKRKSKVFVRCVAKVERGARELAREKGCSVVLCGHTHHAAGSESRGVAYFNSGCWTERPGTYLEVRGGAVLLREYLRGDQGGAPAAGQADNSRPAAGAAS
jgi:UDP-2,3-diacylglucosamine pyrophosphatase LpxH